VSRALRLSIDDARHRKQRNLMAHVLLIPVQADVTDSISGPFNPRRGFPPQYASAISPH
jgi:hypothetical protein